MLNTHLEEFASSEASLHLMSNGLQVLVLEDNRFPLVVMRLYVHAGSAYEHPEEAGISHLLEHMAFKDDKTNVLGETVLDIEAVGGSLNAATGFDHTVYMLDLPADYWSLGLTTLYRLVSQSEIAEQELAREKEVVLAELEKNEDNPQHRVFEGLQRDIWANTPYERPVIGYRNTVRQISSEHIQNYISRLYQPQSMLLVVCGQIRENEILEEVDKHFADLENDYSLALTKPSPISQKSTGPCIQVQTSPLKKVYLGMGFPAPGMLSPYISALEVLSYLLGGDKTSTFYRKFIHEECIVDDITISPVILERGGMLFLQAQLDSENLKRFWEELMQEFASLEAGSFSAQELERAKLNIEDSLFQTKETLSGLASKIGYFQFFEKGIHAEKQYLYQLRHLGFTELQEAIENHVQPDQMFVNALLPEDAEVTKDHLLEKIYSCWPQKKDEQKQSLLCEEKEKMCYDLANHCSLVVIPDKSLPYTALDLSWPGGDLLLSEQEQGVAALTAKSLTRGANGWEALDIQKYLAERASYLEAYTGRDQFSITAKFPTRFSSEVLALIKDIVFKPSFPEQEVKKAVQEQMAVIVERCDHPLGIISRELFPFLFQNHPYSFYHLGKSKELGCLNSEQLRSFWRVQSQKPWVLSVCGEIDKASVVELAKSLTQLPGEDFNYTSELHWAQEKQKELKLTQRQQAHILVCFPVPGLGDSSNAGISLLKNVLAGQGGVLFQELRDRKGLGYAVVPILWRTPVAGLLGFYIGTFPEKSEKALQGFQEVVRDLKQEAISTKNLDRAKNLLQVEYYREQQSLLARSSEASDLLTYELPLNYQQDLITQAIKLSAGDIQELARQYLIWEKAYVLEIQPE